MTLQSYIPLEHGVESLRSPVGDAVDGTNLAEECSS
jgi:hypothetical protein